jgi:hypothetical protein
VGVDILPCPLEIDVGDLVADAQAMDAKAVDADGQARIAQVTSPRQPSTVMPRQACSIMKAEPAAQAWGRQATG